MKGTIRIIIMKKRFLVLINIFIFLFFAVFSQGCSSISYNYYRNADDEQSQTIESDSGSGENSDPELSISDEDDPAKKNSTDEGSTDSGDGNNQSDPGQETSVSDCFQANSVKRDFQAKKLISVGKNFTYTVQKGDTLYSISKKYGIEITIIQSLNNLGESSVIKVGQKLVLSKEELSVYAPVKQFTQSLKTDHVLKIKVNPDEHFCFSIVSDGIVEAVEEIRGYGLSIIIRKDEYILMISGFDTIGVKPGDPLSVDDYIGSLNTGDSLYFSLFKGKIILPLSSFIE